MRTTLANARPYALPILLGSAILVVGVLPWLVLAPINARIRPDLPWAALLMAAFLVLYVAWLNGAGWPRAWRERRHYRLRLWRPTQSTWTEAGLGPTATFVGLLVGLTVLWILVSAPDQPPDLTPYPTTSFRISILVTGAVVSGVVEEVAFRGYMQSGLERFGAGTAIVVTSVVFVLFHGVHGWQTLLLLGPGFFVASVLYGMLAYHTGSIVPGAIIHVLGDMAYTFFGTLGGDARLWFAP
jgi:membrane protease YdiL (CAAX protease family)